MTLISRRRKRKTYFCLFILIDVRKEEKNEKKERNSIKNEFVVLLCLSRIEKKVHLYEETAPSFFLSLTRSNRITLLDGLSLDRVIHAIFCQFLD